MRTSRIRTFSARAYESGDPGLFLRPGFVSIRIADPGVELPEVRPEGVGAEHTFHFLDVESGERGDEFALDLEQAERIITILNDAKSQGLDVAVHCNRGIYRSGAVAAAATSLLGFRYAGTSHPPYNRHALAVLGRAYCRVIQRPDEQQEAR